MISQCTVNLSCATEKTSFFSLFFSPELLKALSFQCPENITFILIWKLKKTVFLEMLLFFQACFFGNSAYENNGGVPFLRR